MRHARRGLWPLFAATLLLLFTVEAQAYRATGQFGGGGGRGTWGGGRGRGRSPFRWRMSPTRVKEDASRSPRYKPQPGFVTRPSLVVNPHAPPLAGRPVSEAGHSPAPNPGSGGAPGGPVGRFPEAYAPRTTAIQAPVNHAAWHDGYWGGWWENGPAWRWRAAPWFHEAGYSLYRNPFAESGELGRPAGRDAEMTEDSRRHFEAARISFRSGKLDRSLLQVEASLGVAAGDGALHEFRALVLFALGRYRKAAAEIHAVLATTPGWSKETRDGLYRDPGDYIVQLSELDKQARGNPTNAELGFLLAYHRLTAGDLEAATAPLDAAAKGTSDDSVLADLLRSVANPETPLVEAPPVPYDLEGSWRARAPGGGSIELSFTPDGAFSWSYTTDGGDRSFRGRYKSFDGTISLREESGGPTDLVLLPHGGDAFELKPVAAPADAPGLSFERKPSR